MGPLFRVLLLKKQYLLSPHHLKIRDRSCSNPVMCLSIPKSCFYTSSLQKRTNSSIHWSHSVPIPLGSNRSVVRHSQSNVQEANGTKLTVLLIYFLARMMENVRIINTLRGVSGVHCVLLVAFKGRRAKQIP